MSGKLNEVGEEYISKTLEWVEELKAELALLTSRIGSGCEKCKRYRQTIGNCAECEVKTFRSRFEAVEVEMFKEVGR